MNSSFAIFIRSIGNEELRPGRIDSLLFFVHGKLLNVSWLPSTITRIVENENGWMHASFLIWINRWKWYGFRKIDGARHKGQPREFDAFSVFVLVTFG